MNINHITELLNTICQYNSVRITQTFTLDNEDLILASCVPDTTILELTFLKTSKVESFNTVEEAAAVIDIHLNRTKVL